MSIQRPTQRVKRKRTGPPEEVEDRLRRAAHPSDLALNQSQLTHRNNVLAGAGFATYDEYLASDYHLRIREYVLERDERVCRVCNTKLARDVHYLSPTQGTLLTRPRNRRDSVQNRRLERVIAVCRPCHYYATQQDKNLSPAAPAAEKKEPRRWSGDPTMAAPRVRR